MIQFYGTTKWDGDGDYFPISFEEYQMYHRIGRYGGCKDHSLGDYVWERFWEHLNYVTFLKGFGVEPPYSLLDVLQEDEEILLWLIQNNHMEMDISWATLLYLMSGCPTTKRLGLVEKLLTGGYELIRWESKISISA